MTSAVQEQEPTWKRAWDAINFGDHTNRRDPYGLSTLGQRWQDKTIGKEWREGQMADIWNLLPDEWKPGVAEWGKGMAEKFGTAWMDARTLEGKEWLDPGKIAAAGTARSLEAIGLPFELLAQGVTQVTGLDIELSRIASDFIPVGAGISKLSKIARQSRLAKRVSQLQNLAPNELAYLQSQANKIKQITEPGGKWGFVEDAAGIPSISGAEEAGLLMRVNQNLRPFEAFESNMTTLRPQGPYRFLGKRKASAQMVTDPTGKKGYRVTPEVEKAFLDEGVRQSAERAKAFGYDLGKMEAHHTALLRQLFESLNGLDDDFIDLGARFYERELGFKIGWDIEDALSIPQPWHPRLHSLINSRISSRSNAWDLGGIEKKFNLAPDWQKTLQYEQRKPIFREISSVIKQSIKDTELLYKGLNSRTLKSGKLSKKDYINLAFDLAELDNRLRGLKNPGFMVKEGLEGLETASDIINHILKNADRVDLTLPSFKKLNVNQTKAVAKVLLQENGAKALYEAIVTGQSADTVFKANNLLFTENNRIWKRILTKLDPDDLLKSGMSIEDVDAHIRAGWADPRKAKSSLKELDVDFRTDWTKEQLRQRFPNMSEFDIQEWIEAQEYINYE